MRQVKTRHNVRRFDEDVRRSGSYSYTADRLSCRLANGRISSGILAALPMAGKSVLDLGCGDGTYSLELAAAGAASVLGVDAAPAAVESATQRAAERGLQGLASFQYGDINDLRLPHRFDCVVLRGVLHHLPDPAAAIISAARWSDTVLILEPNGLNPALKIIERLSRYHRAHEERSFLPRTLRRWCREAGFSSIQTRFINLVPMFCPDWLARPLAAVGPALELVPLARAFCCGQIVVLAQKQAG